MVPRPCWGWKRELDVAHVGCSGDGGSQPGPVVPHGLLSSLLAPTLVRLKHKYWDIRVGGSFSWKYITWPWCPFSFWPFWWWERCNKELWPARTNLGDENLGHPWFISTDGVQGVPTSREHLKWNNRDCVFPLIINKSKPAGKKSSFTSFFIIFLISWMAANVSQWSVFKIVPSQLWLFEECMNSCSEAW